MEVFFSHKLIVSVTSLSWISRKDGSTGFRSKGNCGRGIKAPLGQQGPLPVGCFWCSHVSTLGKKMDWKKRNLTKLRLQMLSVVVSHFLSLWFCTLCRYKIPTVGVCVRQSAEWNAVNESGLKAHEIFCHYMTDAAASVQRPEAKETSAVALMQHSSVGQNTVLWLVGVESQKCCWAAKSCKARTKYIPTKRICFTWKVVIWTRFAKNEKKKTFVRDDLLIGWFGLGFIARPVCLTLTTVFFNGHSC